MPTDGILLELAARLSAAVEDGAGIEAVLADVLAELEGRAIGLWRVAGEQLVMLGFAAVADMPADVQRAFRESTGEISLSLVRFGIVKAVVTGEPTVMRAEDAVTSPAGSPGWLLRFDSSSSLSVPVRCDGGIVGVFAVSSRESFDPESGGGARLMSIAEALEMR